MRAIIYAALPLAMLIGQARAETVVTRADPSLFGIHPGGALVCPSGDVIDLATELVAESYEISVMPPEIQKQLQAQHGTPLTGFRPESVGCMVVPPGTRLQAERIGPYWHVTGSGVDGYATFYSVGPVR